MSTTVEQWQEGKAVDGVPPWDGTGIPLPVDENGWPEIPGGRVFTNLVTNPSFETASAEQVVLNENLVSGPQASDVTDWEMVLGDGQATLASEPVTGWPVPTAAVMTWTVAPTVGYPTEVGLRSDKTYLEAHEIFHGTYLVESSIAQRLSVLWTVYNAEGEVTSSESAGSKTLEPGVPVKGHSQVQVDSPGGWVRAFVRLTTDSVLPTVGSTIKLSAHLIEVEEYNEPDYFDGDTAGTDPDLSYQWTGEHDASPSVLAGVGLEGIAGVTATGRVVQSSEWALSGGKSARLVPFGGPSWLALEGLERDKTYTVLGTAHHNGDLAAAAPGPTRRIQYSGTQQSAQFPAAAGDYPLRLTFTVDKPATRVTLGGDLSGAVWWDDVLLVEGEYAGDYFDGDTPADADHVYAWTGEPHASTSTSSPVAADDEGFDPGEATVAEVQAYLSEHPEQTETVLDRERAGKARTTLIGA